MKTTAISWIVTLFFIFISWECFNMYRDEHLKSERLLTDLKISRDSCRYFISKDGQNATKIQVQQNTISEIRKTLPDLIKQAKSLYIAPRLIRQYSYSTEKNVVQIKTVVRDSVIHDTIHIKAFNYRDRFNLVHGTIQRDTAFLSISSCDTIRIFNTTGRRRHPWAWILSKRKPDEMVIKNANPNNHIYIKEVIHLK